MNKDESPRIRLHGAYDFMAHEYSEKCNASGGYVARLNLDVFSYMGVWTPEEMAAMTTEQFNAELKLRINGFREQILAALDAPIKITSYGGPENPFSKFADGINSET